MVVDISSFQCPLFRVSHTFGYCFRVVDYLFVHESWFIPIITAIVVLE